MAVSAGRVSGPRTVGSRQCADFEIAEQEGDFASRQVSLRDLILGAEDHFVPFHQAADFEESLVNAKSVMTRIFDRASGGAEHGQLGAATLWHAVFFNGLHKTVEAPSRA